MRLALISDIHGDLQGLHAAMARIQTEGADAVYALGDMVSGMGDTRGGRVDSGRVLDQLMARGVQMLRGNWDDLVIDVDAHIHRTRQPEIGRRGAAEARATLTDAHLALLAGLPTDVVVEPEPGRRLHLCHAAPGDPWSLTCRPDVPLDTLRQVYGASDADLIAYGHYHGHHVIGLDGKLLVNVASVGMRDDGLAALTFVEYSGRWTVRQWLEPCKRGG